MFSLYDDLPPAKDEDSNAIKPKSVVSTSKPGDGSQTTSKTSMTWSRSSSANMLAQTLKLKQKQLQTQQEIKKAPTATPTAASLSLSALQTIPSTPTAESPLSPTTEQKAGAGSFSVLIGGHAEPPPIEVIDEYDPMKPNEYEEYLKEKVSKARAIHSQKEREYDVSDRERDAEMMDIQSPVSPPPASGEEAYLRRLRMSGVESSSPTTTSAQNNKTAIPFSYNDDDDDEVLNEGTRAATATTTSDTTSPTATKGKGESAAAKMMAKMGWKGQGLGKNEQGITAPLQHKKTGRVTGTIVTPVSKSQPPEKKAKKAPKIAGGPSRVVLLRNMVGAGEVDDSLQAETAEECQKYGTVKSVLIFEVTDPNLADEREAVRIFVQFETKESATKALEDLDGRYFGGRMVDASYFDESRFDKMDLAPNPAFPDPPLKY